MLVQICHNDFDGKNYIQVIYSGCVVAEIPLDGEKIDWLGERKEQWNDD